MDKRSDQEQGRGQLVSEMDRDFSPLLYLAVADRPIARATTWDLGTNHGSQPAGATQKLGFDFNIRLPTRELICMLTTKSCKCNDQSRGWWLVMSCYVMSCHVR